MNIEQDKQVAEAWRDQTFSDTYMSPENLAYLVVNGFGECETNPCISKHYCGEDACRCIRSVFPHPQYYEQYHLLRKLKKKIDVYVKAVAIGENYVKAREDYTKRKEVR